MDKGKLIGLLGIVVGLFLLGLAGLIAYCVGPRGGHVPDRHRPVTERVRGLVAWWKFDERDGTIAYDSAGNNHGTTHGAAWANGRIGGALDFDGGNDYVSVPHDAGLNITGDITISAWVYFTEGGTGQDGMEKAIVTKCVVNGATNNPFDFRTDNMVEQLKLRLVRGDTRGHECVYSDQGISLNSWHHVLARVENKIADFYVDGGVTPKHGTLSKTPTGNMKPLLIGRRDDGLYLSGTIDDVRIYDRALSAGEIWRLYQEALQGR
ncbi:MAG: LamG domain-containing protein [Planctomycetota bacterium]